MIRFSKIFFYITVAVLLVWQLPWCYAFLTLKPVKTPFTMYSSVLGDFVITQLDENKQLHRYDTKGNTYTQQQVDSLLPSLYVRQLTADERFPDTICGKAVSPKDISIDKLYFQECAVSHQCSPDRTLFSDGVHVQTGGFENARRCIPFYR